MILRHLAHVCLVGTEVCFLCHKQALNPSTSIWMKGAQRIYALSSRLVLWPQTGQAFASTSNVLFTAANGLTRDSSEAQAICISTRTEWE